MTVGARASEGGGVECRVSDTGEGVDPGRLEKVFEKGETDGRQGGTGLGLAIVKRVVEAHGGRAWAEGAPGEGATFIFTIPGASEAGGSGARE